jgi:hypothetical protein
MIIDGLLQFDPALSAITVTRASHKRHRPLEPARHRRTYAPGDVALDTGSTQPSQLPVPPPSSFRCRARRTT